MAPYQEVIISGGTLKPSEDTAFYVSFWHIPGGADYSNVTAVSAYFDNEEQASRFVKRYEQMPEMAFMMPYADHLKALKACSIS